MARPHAVSADPRGGGWDAHGGEWRGPGDRLGEEGRGGGKGKGGGGRGRGDGWRGQVLSGGTAVGAAIGSAVRDAGGGAAEEGEEVWVLGHGLFAPETVQEPLVSKGGGLGVREGKRGG